MRSSDLLPTQKALKPLSVNDLLFINEYMILDRNGTKTYQRLHPKASYDVAASRAYQILQKPSVSAELAIRTQHEAGVTKEFVQGHLLNALTLADASHDPAKITLVCRELAEIAGLKVVKHEDVTEKEFAEKNLVEEMRRRINAN